MGTTNDKRRTKYGHYYSDYDKCFRTCDEYNAYYDTCYDDSP